MPSLLCVDVPSSSLLMCLLCCSVCLLWSAMCVCKGHFMLRISCPTMCRICPLLLAVSGLVSLCVLCACVLCVPLCYFVLLCVTCFVSLCVALCRLCMFWEAQWSPVANRWSPVGLWLKLTTRWLPATPVDLQFGAFLLFSSRRWIGKITPKQPKKSSSEEKPESVLRKNLPYLGPV